MNLDLLNTLRRLYHEVPFKNRKGLICKLLEFTNPFNPFLNSYLGFSYFLTFKILILVFDSFIHFSDISDIDLSRFH